MIQKKLSLLLLCLFAIATTGCQQDAVVDEGSQQNSSQTPETEGGEPVVKLETAKLGSTPNLTQFGNVYLAGQFTENDVQILKDDGVEVVINLREESEMDWDEKGKLEEAGIEYIWIPFSKPDTLTDQVFADVRAALKENEDRKVMLHCRSAGRVGCVWGAYRGMEGGLSIDEAIEEGEEVGMRSWLTGRLREYLEEHKE